jgi:hypothetical protein
MSFCVASRGANWLNESERAIVPPVWGTCAGEDFVISGSTEGGVMKTQTLALVAVALFLSGQLKAQPTNTYGTSTTSYYTISESGFFPLNSTVQYSATAGLAITRHKWATTTFGTFTASPSLPSGALITSIELDYCDTNGSNHVLGAIVGCDYKGLNCVELGSLLTSPSDGCNSIQEDVSSAGWTVDNYLNRLSVVVETQSGDFTNRFSGVIIYYQLQVSPAPTTATFVDVPTTSPIFRFVEALHSSGITAGCDATHYCPSASLTRGQMAVYLATALGLQWQ